MSRDAATSAGDSIGTPKHERLRAHLVRALQSGKLRPGDALPTEHELAAESNVSRNTVRQALAGLESSGVVRRIPGRGTFIHDDALLRLKSGLDVFALVIPETRGGFYPSLQRGFHEASVGLHNQVIVSDTDNDPYRQADALLQLLDKRVAGVAIVPTTEPPTPAHQVRPLQKQGVPVVFCHRPVEGVRAPLVSFDPLEVGRIAGREIVGRGHRRVALFGAQRIPFSGRYEEGLREALEGKGASLPTEFVRWDSSGRMTPEHERFVAGGLRAVFGSAAPPTAIFCAFDSEAELVYLLLSGMGVKVPEQVSLVGWGGTWREGAIARRLTSVAVDEEELGRTAVRLLDEMRRGERRIEDVSEILMPLTVCRGETLGPAPSGARRKR